MPTTALLLGLALLGQTEVPVPGCGDPPSIASSGFWDHIAACGCAKTVPPSRASLDYDRYLQACAQWRRENPQVNVIVVDPSPEPRSSPTPQPSASPSGSPKPTPSPTATPKSPPTPKPVAAPSR